jgi:hypothetical protein
VSLFCIITATDLHCSHRSSDGWLSPGPSAGLSVELACPAPNTAPRGVPRLWVPSEGDVTHLDGLRAVKHENNRAGQDVHDGDGIGVDTDVVTAWAPPGAGMMPVGTADSAEVVITPPARRC